MWNRCVEYGKRKTATDDNNRFPSAIHLSRLDVSFRLSFCHSKPTRSASIACYLLNVAIT